MDELTREVLARTLRRKVAELMLVPMAGAVVSQAWKVSAGDCTWFIKTAPSAEAAILVSEKESLEAMAGVRQVRVPKVVSFAQDNGKVLLVLEFLDLVPANGEEDWRRLGQSLAILHRQIAPRYGWEADNFIGPTLQLNGWEEDWSRFFWNNRLRPLVEAAVKQGAGINGLWQALHRKTQMLLEGHQPPPSLLHGDLWSGNAGFLHDGVPVLFDPASYFGDRETDLALSSLFGGFGSAYYQAYEEVWPFPPGWEQRRYLYQLYHLLNHRVVFGVTYEETLQSCLAQILQS